jgi:2-polyprenyl-6-methoxyphenol hydroxylase-like FAD-dependent oxidoreductase
MHFEVTDLIVAPDGAVVGARATGPDGELEVRADLVAACDGRHSVLREKARLAVKDLGAPLDVLWFRLPRRPSDPDQAMGRFDVGRLFVMINRGEHWQCGYLIPKGGAEVLQAGDLEAFRQDVAQIAPVFADRVAEISAWDDISVLSVRVDRLEQWHRDGLLCIGDAAHAMSPVGGVGINLAIQDAVAAANLLAAPLRQRRVVEGDLRRLQRRREWPTRVTQRVQVVIQNRALKPVLQGKTRRPVPTVLRLVDRFPALQRIPAGFVGLGVRPEHIHQRAS